MQVRDALIIRMVEHIGDHYRTNIANRFIRPVLLQLSIEKQTWDLIEALTERDSQYQGYDLTELYRQILACAHFVAHCRHDLVPNIRNRTSSMAPSGTDKVLWDMAINNFASNLKVFADLVNELYVKLVEMDRINAKGRRPLYLQTIGLEDIGRLLVEN